MADVVKSQLEQRVLLMAPTPRDAEITVGFLNSAGLACVSCGDLFQISRELRDGCGAVLLTEEALTAAGIGALIMELESQPAWSDLPLVMLMHGGIQSPESSRVLQLLRNLTLLERPATTRSVVSAVRAAVRARQRQYQAREQIAEIQRAEAQYKGLQQQLEIAIDASELGTFHCEIPLGKILWNDRCKAHFWLPPEAEINFDLFYSILHPDESGGRLRLSRHGV
jgi:PAS domain-containing protein